MLKYLIQKLAKSPEIYFTDYREPLRLSLLLAMPIVAVVVIVVVATVVAVTAAVSSADGKIRATSAVDPNASVIIAPSLSEHAGSFAPLANQADTTVGVDAAAAEVEVIGRANVRTP